MALYLRSRETMPASPSRQALQSALLPSASIVSSTSTPPYWRRYDTTSTNPLEELTCSGVHPSANRSGVSISRVSLPPLPDLGSKD